MFMFHIHHLEPSEIELKERSFIYTSYLLLIEKYNETKYYRERFR